MHLLREPLIFLAATVVVVPLFKRFGLGSVLGYLAAGAVIGPFGLKAIGDVDRVLQLSELGVVLLLFLIGLELQPSRLWALRRTVFGLGSLQVGATTGILGGLGLLFGLGWRAALVAGIGLSLSSTAFAVQLLAEKRELATPYGQASFGILLFQDLAVIPMLAILPMLAAGGPPPSWTGFGRVVVVLALVVFIAPVVVRRVFRVVATAQSQELFTATALLIALGTAALMNRFGVSMALGAFVAGVLLAGSRYRHEIEADVEPFKGLLLGLFFIAVGMSANLRLVLSRPLAIAGLLFGLLAVKIAVVFALGRKRLQSSDEALSLAVVLSQGGEFAFVLFGLAVGFRVLDQPIAELLVVVVTLSMGTTPALLGLYQRFVRPRLRGGDQREFDVSPMEDTPVIIAGFGRVGQMAGRVLRARRIPFTALDASPEHIDFLKRYGNKVFYGDASRLDLLRAARADRARVFVVAIDDVAASLRVVEMVLAHFPHLQIIARARNRVHAYRLLSLGITHLHRETFATSLEMTADVLEALGISHEEAVATVDRFRQHDEQQLLTTAEFQQDEKKLIEIAEQARAELESIFEKDAADRRSA